MFRLFKRDRAGRELPKSDPGYRERPYYFRFTHHGRVYVRTLETPDANEAHRRARAKHAAILAAVAAGEYHRLDPTKLRQDASATLDQLCAAYTAGPAEASADTRAANIHALRAIAAGATHVRDLTPALVRAWFDAANTRTQAAPDQQSAASIKRSANSRWAQARSLFTDRCLAHYLDLGIIPRADHLETFVRAGNASTFIRIPKISYNPPADAIIAATLAAWETLQDRDLFLAIGHELAFGLRKGELEQALWSWHTIRNGYPVLDGRATVKSGTGLIQVRALNPWWGTMIQRIAAAGWRTAAEDHIITGTDTYRQDGIFRRVSEWLRDLGWGTNKTNHALRAYAGSQVAMRYGIYEAQMWLRHSTVKVTEQHYSHFVSRFKPETLDQLPVTWASLPAQPAPATQPAATPAPADAPSDYTPNVRYSPLQSPTVHAQTGPRLN